MTSPDAGRLDDALRLCRAGDQSGYAALYDLFAGGVYRLCYGLLLHREDAEDVAQEAFVYSFRNLHRFDPARASFKTWLYTIAISRCRNHYRRSRRPMLDLSALVAGEVPAPRSQTPEAAHARRSAHEALERALADLKPALREAVVLRYAHGLTYREAAEIMDCPPKTAESRVRLAHETLRKALDGPGQGLLEELWAWRE
jgi:RNA polymerase sigma-70 factor (ECF subfamily)